MMFKSVVAQDRIDVLSVLGICARESLCVAAMGWRTLLFMSAPPSSGTVLFVIEVSALGCAGFLCVASIVHARDSFTKTPVHSDVSDFSVP